MNVFPFLAERGEMMTGPPGAPATPQMTRNDWEHSGVTPWMNNNRYRRVWERRRRSIGFRRPPTIHISSGLGVRFYSADFMYSLCKQEKMGKLYTPHKHPINTHKHPQTLWESIAIDHSGWKNVLTARSTRKNLGEWAVYDIVKI